MSTFCVLLSPLKLLLTKLRNIYQKMSLIVKLPKSEFKISLCFTRFYIYYPQAAFFHKSIFNILPAIYHSLLFVNFKQIL